MHSIDHLTYGRINIPSFAVVAVTMMYVSSSLNSLMQSLGAMEISPNPFSICSSHDCVAPKPGFQVLLESLLVT